MPPTPPPPGRTARRSGGRGRAGPARGEAPDRASRRFCGEGRSPSTKQPPLAVPRRGPPEPLLRADLGPPSRVPFGGRRRAEPVGTGHVPQALAVEERRLPGPLRGQ